MAIDALLVYLPVQFGGGRNFGLPPLGVYYLATVLKERGLDVRILDASIKGLTLDETIKIINDYDPRVLGISAMTSHLRSLKAMIDRLNGDGFKGRIAVGGAHFNATHEEALEYLDVDYVFYGESEKPFLEFVEATLAGASVEGVPGMAFRQGARIKVNPAADFIADLDELPFPDLGLGNPDDYEFVIGRYDRITTLMASRGCPYTCKFCDVFAIWGRRLRLRSPRNIVDEMEWNVDKLGIREFVFKDSTFTLNHKWLARFLEELEERNLDILWHCNTRTDRVDREMMRRMRRVGLRSVSYGVESGDQDIIDAVDKNLDLKDVVPVFRMTEEEGIQAQAFFMVGHIGETPETAQKTLDLALRLPATFASFSPNTAYPGTPCYDEALALGLLRDARWYLHDLGEKQFLSMSSMVSPGQLNLPGFPPEQQIAFSKKAYRKFYLRPVTVYRLFRRFVSIRLLKRSLMFLPTFLGYSFSRKHSANPFVGGYASRQAATEPKPSAS